MVLLLIASVVLNIYLLEYTLKGKTIQTAVSAYKVVKDWVKSLFKSKKESK